MNLSSDPVNTLENLISKNKARNISIYLVIVLSVILSLVLLPIIKIDISSQSRGIIRTQTENVPIFSITSGRIVWLNIKNNAVVKKGDTLIKIAKQNIEEQKRTQNELSESVLEMLEDINSVLLRKTNNLKTTTISESLLKFQTKKNELTSKVSQARVNFDRNKILFDKNIIAKVEIEKYEQEFLLSQYNLENAIRNQKVEWETQKRELEDRLKSLKGEVNKLLVEESNYDIIAPISGIIENFSGIQNGSFLNSSQPIASISAIDYLIVESNVAPKDIGLIKKNQKVKFQLDAFNYNQWGLLKGKVIDIDKNITIQGEQAFFKVRCSLESNVLQLKSGYKANVSKGMTLTTRYIITRRSLFDLLFDKVDNWLNPKQIANKN